jgi:hypothetical protein
MFWLRGIQLDAFEGVSFTDAPFFIRCAPLFVLTLLAFSRSWASFTSRPLIFALVYSVPFFVFTFADSLGDMHQVIDLIYFRYWMSEPLSTFIHYWVNRWTGEAFNLSPQQTIALSHRCLGILYMWAVARSSLALLPHASPQKQLIYRLVFATSGVTLLFFGYIENTTAAIAFEVVWLWIALLFMADPKYRYLITSAVVFAITVLAHGRSLFLVPAFLSTYALAPGSLTRRALRVISASIIFAGCIALFMYSIYHYDRESIIGWPIGNGSGGGNGRRFVPLDVIFQMPWLIALSKFQLMAAGALMPIGLLLLLWDLRKLSAFSLWSLVYVLSGYVYVLGWEFDFGPFVDWDLVFSSAVPFIFVAALAAARDKFPVSLAIAGCLCSTYMTMTFAVLVNHGPLAFIVPPYAGTATTGITCATPGLKTTYFADPQLSTVLGAPQVSTPGTWYTTASNPAGGKPFGGVLEGFIRIPSPGRYRFELKGSRRYRVRLADTTLFDEWMAPRMFKREREMRFGSAGLFPIKVEFYTETGACTPGLRVSSSTFPVQEVGMEILCHD